MIRNVCAAVAATVLIAAAEDLPWRFDGDVTREAASTVVRPANVSAPVVRAESAGPVLPDAVDGSVGRSTRASDVLAIFDSRPTAFMIIFR